MPFRSDKMREIFQGTEIIRRPTYGIVKGYHELPYICVGRRPESESGATRIRGKIMVSPQFVIKPSQYLPHYDEIFADEDLDFELRGRIFGYLGFAKRPVECSSENLEIQHHDASVDQLLAESLDELDRYEDISTGVIVTPNSRYYPVSVERFIAAILDDEFHL